MRYCIFVNRAAKEMQQPHTANQPNLAALQLSRAEPKLPQFWSDFSEILDLGSTNIKYTLELHAPMKFRVVKTPNVYTRPTLVWMKIPH